MSQRYTKTEIETLTSLAGKKNVKEIAQYMGRSVDSVRKKSAEIGLSLRIKKYSDWDIRMVHALYKEGVCINTIAEKLELTRATALYILHNKHPEMRHAH
ncbi:hypothetical protein GBN32_00370 [Plesiomonas shigelloides]|uniref:hypothetical protein n=1 Tax=Plesiomonas shigelloides TaxID=703 RepID=UPI0012627105|nr:hypothetical protein [Plesiomonas shigelloides]KAB7715726.1 hypothetical protein GBN32_00370 [Plesiomonas shigelloides]